MKIHKSKQEKTSAVSKPSQYKAKVVPSMSRSKPAKLFSLLNVRESGTESLYLAIKKTNPPPNPI